MKSFNDNIPPRAPGGTWLERTEHTMLLQLEQDIKKYGQIPYGMFSKSFKRNLVFGCGEAFHVDNKGNIKDLND